MVVRVCASCPGFRRAHRFPRIWTTNAGGNEQAAEDVATDPNPPHKKRVSSSVRSFYLGYQVGGLPQERHFEHMDDPDVGICESDIPMEGTNCSKAGGCLRG